MIFNIYLLDVPSIITFVLLSLEIIPYVYGQASCTQTKYVNNVWGNALPANGYYYDDTCDYRCNAGYFRNEWYGHGIYYDCKACSTAGPSSCSDGLYWNSNRCGGDWANFLGELHINQDDSQCMPCNYAQRASKEWNVVSDAEFNNPTYFCTGGVKTLCTVRTCTGNTYFVPCGPQRYGQGDWPYQAYYDSKCETCQTCSSSYYESSPCTGTSNRGCTYCEQGFYCSTTTSRTACPSNTNSPSGSTAVSACTSNANYYGNPGVAATACPPFSSSPAGSTVVTQCLANAGYIGAGTITLCPLDFYCTGSNTKVACLANTTTNGTYGAATLSRCMAKSGFYGTAGTIPQFCPLNTFSNAGASWLTQCTANAGFFGTAGTIAQVCPINTFSTAGSTSQGNCTANAGFYGSGVAITCNASFYCTGSNTRIGCPPNSNSLPGSTVITNCTANAGYYGLPGSIPTACNTAACSTGQYRKSCAAGSTVDASCTACTNLPASNAVYTSAGTGIGVSNCLWQCNSAYYNNNVNCSLCSVAACSVGQYRSTCPAGSIADASCTACTNGIANTSYTSAGTGIAISNCAWQCVAGFFLNAGACSACPQYTTSPAGSTTITVCTSMANYYGSPGIAATSCPPNSWSSPGSTLLIQCLSNAGYEGAGTIIICAPDFYCPGSNVKVPCPSNTFTNGASGAVSASNCLAKQGYYYTVGSIAQLCPPNTSSQIGSVNITDCAANQGFFGPPGTIPITCPSNYYCPTGATSALACPNNTNSPPGSSAITNCVSNQGFYGQPGSNVTLCPPNAYCPVMSVNFNPCPSFSTSPSGSFSIANCTPVPGYYRNPDFSVSQCNPGWYCPSGSLERLPCPTFTSSPNGASLLTQCTAIAGYFGQPGSVASACPFNTNSPSANANGSIFSCTCNFGFTCEYKNNIYVTVNLNITTDKFSSYTKQYIVAILADAAAVSIDNVVPASDKISLGSSIQISYWINGASALYYASTCGAMLDPGSSVKTIMSLSWQNQESVKVKRIQA